MLAFQVIGMVFLALFFGALTGNPSTAR